MKLSEYQNEDALDLLADILEPTARIFADPAVANASRSNKTKIEIVKLVIKNHESDVIDILARLDNTPRKEYKCNVVSITMKLLEILNDKELTDFFTLQAQTEEKTASIVPMENTEVKNK